MWELAAGCGRLERRNWLDLPLPECYSNNMIDDAVSNQRRLPSPENCRTRYLGESLGFTKCLVKDPEDCPYAVRFASGVSCYHPDRRNFDRTGLA
jgi:hypothetical protein